MKKQVDITNGVRTGPRPVGSIETPQAQPMPCKVSSEMSSTSTHNDQQMDKQAPERQELENLKRKDKAILTAVGDTQYDVKFSKKGYSITYHSTRSY